MPWCVAGECVCVRVRVSVFGTRIDYGPNNKINFTQTQAALCGSHQRNFIQFVRFIHTTFSLIIILLRQNVRNAQKKSQPNCNFAIAKATVLSVQAPGIPLTWDSMPRGIEISASATNFVRISICSSVAWAPSFRLVRVK